MKKNILILSVLFLVFFAIGIVSAQEASYCCEKTVEGALCQNQPSLDDCNQDYHKDPTNCESTSYCKLGTCIDGQEGICSPNSPESACISKGGYWENKLIEDIAQCQLGCCFLGEQTDFVTQTRCTTLSGFYGLETDFRGDIQNQLQCIASARSDTKGACVIERDYVRDCEFTTKEECNKKKLTTATDEGFLDNLFGGEESEGDIISVDFHEGYLCSAESLGAKCGPSKKTICENDKVYFLDTCGELANIYDASKVNDQNYWTYIKEVDESCGYESSNGNADSKTCGNCDYNSGSTCQSSREGYICGDLSCEYEGEDYKHGEAWCVTNTGEDADLENLPGTEHYKLQCYNGEVTYDDCSRGEFRNRICEESEKSGFRTAGCRVNEASDCISQETEENCQNIEERDCRWIEGHSIFKDEDGNSLTKDENNETTKASCVPLFPPAYNFWEGNTENTLCNLASDICVVEYRIPSTGNKNKIDSTHEDYEKAKRDKWCFKNCECLIDYPGVKDDYNCEEGCRSHEEWFSDRTEICAYMGDCGSTENYLGKEGYFDDDSMLITEFFKKLKDFEKEYN